MSILLPQCLKTLLNYDVNDISQALVSQLANTAPFVRQFLGVFLLQVASSLYGWLLLRVSQNNLALEGSSEMNRAAGYWDIMVRLIAPPAWKQKSGHHIEGSLSFLRKECKML